MKPCGRINSCMVVGRDTLYIYGGMMEVKDQEISLDDLHSLNLSKLDEWKCIIPVCSASLSTYKCLSLSSVVFRWQSSKMMHYCTLLLNVV